MRLLSVVVSLLTVVSCTKPSPAVVTVVDAGSPARAARVRLLITGSENGYLLPTPSDGALRGGAAQVAGLWLRDEGHCLGCDQPVTLALSTGDNGNGQSISGYFKGQPAAGVMKQMGYAASAFGNRELDWSREQFIANAGAGGFPYLASNLRAVGDEGARLGLKPFMVVERQGLRIGVVGLAAAKATWTPMPGRMSGLELLDDAVALAEAIPAARAAGAQTVVIVSDGCLHDAPTLLEGHGDWGVSVFAGRDCEREYPPTVGATRLVYPGRHWNEYARVVLEQAGASVTVTEAALVPVPSDAPAEPQTAARIAEWKSKLDQALGETIGFTATGFEQDSPVMTAWLTTALKTELKADVALINRKGVRQGLPSGPITGASVWDLAPFENEVVTVKVTGAQLEALAENTEARFAGLPKKLEPKKTYTVSTLDYLYLGGDGFALKEMDAAPVSTKRSWQSVLIEWTKGQKSDAKRPLETLVKRP